MKKLNTLISRH